jgi:pantoate--beta-alanine ligase
MARPQLLTRRAQVAEFVASARAQGKSVGFVPTMGALHEGHGALAKVASSENEIVVASIFVNPRQFGQNEDFGRYPRTLSSDLELLGACGTHVVFAPSVQEMYPTGFASSVAVSGLSSVLCGAHRPGHFDGVCTVVMLLLNLVGAHRAYFGMKDFQQLLIIRRMCLDLAHPTQIVPVPTVREEDGLALSSRNRYLEGVSRQRARAVPLALAAAVRLFQGGERSSVKLVDAALREFREKSLDPQYLELRDVETLELIEGEVKGPVVLAVAQPVAVPSGICRLIDNVVLGEDSFYRGIQDDLLRRTT